MNTLDILNSSPVDYYLAAMARRRLLVIANLTVAAAATAVLLWTERLFTTGRIDQADRQSIWYVAFGLYIACIAVQMVLDYLSESFGPQRRKKLPGFPVETKDNDASK